MCPGGTFFVPTVVYHRIGKFNSKNPDLSPGCDAPEKISYQEWNRR
jgi:hypothetical protein